MDDNRIPPWPTETPIDYAFYKAKAARLRAGAKRQAVARAFVAIRQIGANLGRIFWRRPGRTSTAQRAR